MEHVVAGQRLFLVVLTPVIVRHGAAGFESYVIAARTI